MCSVDSHVRGLHSAEGKGGGISVFLRGERVVFGGGEQ